MAPQISRREEASHPGSQRNTAFLAYALLALGCLFAIWLRLRFLQLPLERDEGEYAYMGQLILQGVPPYREAYNMKFPGAYLAYAILELVFGQTYQGLRLGFLGLNLASIYCTFVLARRLFGLQAAGWSALWFAFLSQSPPALGMMGHATVLINACLLPALLALHSGWQKRRVSCVLLGGLGLGMAVLMKQHALVFVAGVAVLFWLNRARFSAAPTEAVPVAASESAAPAAPFFRAALLSLFAGAALPLALTVIILALTGDLGKFYYWALLYASKYVAGVPLRDAPENLLRSLQGLKSDMVPWGAGVAGLGLLLLQRHRLRLAMVGWCLAAGLAVLPGFYFRPHYWIVLFPVLAIGAGYLTGFIQASAAKRFPLILVGAMLLVVVAGGALYPYRKFYPTATPAKYAKTLYGANPVMESVEIARFLAQNTRPDEKIAVIGSEPQIYFYARRRAATGFLYGYPLVENQPLAAEMQRDLMAEVAAARPRFVVLEWVGMAWLPDPNSSREIFIWMRTNFQSYRMRGLIDLYDGSTPARLDWNPVPGKAGASEDSIVVLERPGT